MKKLFIFLTMLVLGIVSSWATYSTTSVSSAKDSKGNYLVHGAFYRILLPNRDGSVALQQNGEFVKANNGYGIIGFMWKIEEDDNGKALISNPAGGYWKFTDYSPGYSKLKTNGTKSDCTAFQMAWASSTDKTLNLFDPNGGSYTYDGVKCGAVLSNHSGIGNNMGIYNDITDGGSKFRFERFYRTTFTFVDINDDPVSDATVTINGSVSATEFYTNSDNQITSFATAYTANYSIDDVSKTAEEVKAAINANTGSLNVKVTVTAVSKHFTINIKDGGGNIVKTETLDAYVGESINLYTLFNIATNYVTLSQTSITVTGDIPSETNVTYEMKDLPFTGSTIGSPAYYAMMISTNNNSWLKSSGTDVTCGANANPLPSGDATNWAWLLIGDAVKGYKLYNVETGKYIGGRTSAGSYLTLVDEASANSFIPVYNDQNSVKFQDQTNNLWIDRASSKTYAHTSGQKFTFQRLYKVKFALSEVTAGLQVGSDVVSDFNTEYIITTSASLSCTASGYSISAYDGYTTLTEALQHDVDGIINLTIQKPITYKLIFNGAEIINARTVVTEDVGATASTPSTWSTPAYCSFTCPSTTITAETTEIEITLTWDGPFDFSADFASAKWYYLKLNNKYVYCDTEESKNPLLFSNDRVEAPKALWAFFGDPYNGVKIANLHVGDGLFVSNNAPAIMDASSFVTNKIGSNNFGFTFYEDGYYLADAGGGVNSTNASGAAESASTAMKVEYIVTYNLKFGGSTIATKTLDKVTGDSKDLLPSEWERDFCSYSYDPEEIGNSTTSVDVTMTWSGPFDISADYENAVWYYIAVNSKWAKNYNWVSPNISSDIETVKGLDDGQWAFIGNPYDGITLMLKAKYDKTWEMYLSASVDNPALTYLIESTEKWTVTRLSDRTFTLNCGDKYLVDNTSNMAFKTTDLVENEGTFSVRSYYCQQALDNWTTYVGESTDKLFGVNPSCASSLDAMIKGMPKMTETEYNTNFATIPNANIAGFITYNQPTTGYYRIKSSGLRSIGESYIGYGSSDYGTGLRTVAAANKMTDVSTVIRLTGSAGTYKISTEGLNVQSQTTANKAFTATTAEGVDFVFTVSSPGVVTIRNAASESGSCQGNLHEGQDGSSVKGVINWQASSDQSKWTVEEAESLTISLNSDGATTPTYYATFCAPFSYTISDGTKAYTLEKSGNWLIPTEIEGEVAAGTPVLLKGTSATATLTIGSGYVGSPLTDTALTGTYLPKTITGTTDYVLGRNDGKVGFYHWNSNNLAANRAYLAAESVAEGARGFALMFEDDATGIVAPIGETEEGTTIYNLSGQRLNKMQKGINIVNGKKVLF